AGSRRAPLTVAVIGGGYAGLSAACHLAAGGHRVELFEAKNFLGGRAHSFTDHASGRVLDNSPHAFFGCYRSFWALCDTLGARHKLAGQDGLAIPYLDRQGRRAMLRAADWPAPWHLLGGLFGCKALTMRDRLAIIQFGARLKFGGVPHDDETAGHWLRRLGQTANAIRCLWEPFCLAALNEHPDTASANLLRAVIRQCLLGAKADSAVYRNRVGLSELLSPELDRFLAATDSRLHRNRGVRAILFAGAGVSGLRLADGTTVTADAYVSAVPCPALRALLPPDAPLTANLRRIGTAPILSVYLTTDCPILSPGAFTALLDSPVQWIFNHDRAAAPGPHLHNLTISAAGRLMDLPNDELLALLWAEINRYFPATAGGRILRHLIYKSRDATMSAIPGVEQFRPGARTAWDNFYLAGDWTQTGLPATIESATLSGQLAAAAVN
ncbi:MAG: hydroxysqualene dehydroxylase HpnE, partial [Verrucomicrobiales bacterium]|nr:hydroxysqualene dehydroxylase HpnE [Verrucomicrobiales bacterium]